MIYAIATAAFIAVIVWLNVWDLRRRKAMTPAERAREDEDTWAW